MIHEQIVTRKCKLNIFVTVLHVGGHQNWERLVPEW